MGVKQQVEANKTAAQVLHSSVYRMECCTATG